MSDHTTVTTERIVQQFGFTPTTAKRYLQQLTEFGYVENKPSDKILFAMDLTAKMAVEQLAQETKLPQEEVLLEFMKSNAAKMLYDDSTKLWWDGPSAVAEEFKSQGRWKNER